MKNKDNLLGVLETLFKWKKPILYTCAIAAIGSILIALLLPVFYKSTTTFYASSGDASSLEQLFGGAKSKLEVYGNENDIDRIMTIAQSNNLATYIVDKFNLYAHYDIDSTSLKAPYRVRQAFFGLYDVQKTKFDAIELSVEDEDPKLAAAIANAARDQIDQIARIPMKESMNSMIETIQKNIDDKESLLGTLNDSLRVVRRRYSIYNTGSQSELLAAMHSGLDAKITGSQAKLDVLKNTRGAPRDTIILLEASVKGYEKQMESLEKDLEKFNEGLSDVMILEQQHRVANSQLSFDKERLDKLKVINGSEVPAIHLLEDAKVPVIKSRPHRSLLVLASVVIAFLFSVIGVLLFDTYRDVDWRKIIHGQ